MKTEKVKISDLKPYKKNNKIHNTEQIEVIRKSIVDYGYIQPICIDKNNEIIIGHGRLEAIKEIQKTGSRGDEVEVVRLEDLTPSQVRKLRLLDNKSSDMADRDFENISFELLELDDSELNDLFDDMEELGDLKTEEQEEKEKIEDEVPEVKEEIIVKEGDVFELGEHRLMCGDSTKIEDVEKLMDGGECGHGVYGPSVQYGL